MDPNFAQFEKQNPVKGPVLNKNMAQPISRSFLLGVFGGGFMLMLQYLCVGKLCRDGSLYMFKIKPAYGPRGYLATYRAYPPRN